MFVADGKARQYISIIAAALNAEYGVSMAFHHASGG